MRDNLILSTDSYKVGHWVQYPPGTEKIYSYFESRGGAYPNTVFFGLQYVLDKLVEMQVTAADIADASLLFRAHFGSDKMFNAAGWNKLIDKHDGKLPIHVKAVPEGSVVPTGNVLMTIENTDPDFYWLTNYLETLLSQVWYPTTVATISHHVRKCIAEYLQMTGTPEGIDFKLHDFGFRGVSSLESAAIGGAAHLVSFLGTDTIPAMKLLMDHYGATEVPGFSVPAAEHSTMTAWGRENEVEAYRNMVTQYGNDFPFYAVVSDSYDIFNAARSIWGEELKSEVLNANGTLVVRPDSGDPVEVVDKLLRILGDRFGVEVNDKGYRVLNPKVRVIWGDGLEPKTIQSILSDMAYNHWSADNITFGMGGGLLQKVNRDTQRFAFKCSSATVNGEQRDVSKSPVGMEFKKSKAGRLMLVKDAWGYKTIPESTQRYGQNLLETVFLDGEFKKRYSLDEIRAKAKEG